LGRVGRHPCAAELVAEDGHAEVGCGALHLGEFLFGCGEAGPQTVDFAEPATLSGLGDPLVETVDDALETLVLLVVGAEHGAADADGRPGRDGFGGEDAASARTRRVRTCSCAILPRVSTATAFTIAVAPCVAFLGLACG